jgi:hypothetical protein
MSGTVSCPNRQVCDQLRGGPTDKRLAVFQRCEVTRLALRFTYCGASKCRALGEKRKSLKRAQTDAADPSRLFSRIVCCGAQHLRCRQHGRGRNDQDHGYEHHCPYVVIQVSRCRGSPICHGQPCYRSTNGDLGLGDLARRVFCFYPDGVSDFDCGVLLPPTSLPSLLSSVCTTTDSTQKPLLIDNFRSNEYVRPDLSSSHKTA